MSPSQNFSTLTHFPLQIFLSFLELSFVTLPLTMWSYMVVTLAHLKCAIEVLLYNQYSFSPEPNITSYYCRYSNTTHEPGSEEVIRTTQFRSKENNEDNQCAVCLSEVKEGDEIGELRCCHVFHVGCLERWIVRFKQMTCPLCRGSLAPPPIGVEVLFFKFCSFRSNGTSGEDERDSWWLR